MIVDLGLGLPRPPTGDVGGRSRLLRSQAEHPSLLIPGKQYHRCPTQNLGNPCLDPLNSPSIRGHVSIMRLDHWIKNVFVVPGAVVALSLDPQHRGWDLVVRGIVACWRQDWSPPVTTH